MTLKALMVYLFLQSQQSHQSCTSQFNGYEKELLDAMGKAFRDHFGQEIGIKLESKMPYVEGDGEFISMSVEDILSGLEGGCDKRLELFRDYIVFERR